MARVLYVATEARLTRGPDGSIRSQFSDTSYAAWAPYLREFERIVVVSRVETSDVGAPLAVEGPAISVLALPNYRGAGGFIRTLPRLIGVIRRSCTDATAIYAGRVPGMIGALLSSRARTLGADFVALVVGDPVEVARSGAAGRVIRWGAPAVGLAMRLLLRRATRASYVTEHVLQARYPVRAGIPQRSGSGVHLPPEAFASAARDFADRQLTDVWHLITVGSQEATYKGHDVLLAAVAQLVAESRLSVQLTIIGGGKYGPTYQGIVADLGLSDHVELAGHIVDPAGVRRRLEAADLFVLPSRTEGLPRALVEAMALALPCLASAVGGIPELLSDECLVPPGEPRELARAIEGLLMRPLEMNRLSRENLAQAHRVVERAQGTDPAAFLAGRLGPRGGASA